MSSGIRLEFRGNYGKEEFGKQTLHSAGIDLIAQTAIFLESGSSACVSTGTFLIVEKQITLPFFFMLCLRSSVAKNTTLRLSNGVGIIDADYRDEIKVLIDNIGDEAAWINAGDRIAQLVPCYAYPHLDVPVKNKDRVGGFGSTGGNIG